jgi:hypothetical protein
MESAVSTFLKSTLDTALFSKYRAFIYRHKLLEDKIDFKINPKAEPIRFYSSISSSELVKLKKGTLQIVNVLGTYQESLVWKCILQEREKDHLFYRLIHQDWIPSRTLRTARFALELYLGQAVSYHSGKRRRVHIVKWRGFEELDFVFEDE